MPDMVLDKTLIGQPRQKYWIQYIKQQIQKNKNFMGFVSGATGSGKSWSCLSIGEDVDSEFNISNVVFSGIELMDLINSGNLKKSSCICFEEVGVIMNSRDWQSITNKMLNFLIQTFRHRNFILLMNSPYISFLDSATRKLFHAEFQTLSIDFKTNECIVKPQLIQYNGRLDKFYYKRLNLITAEGVVPISRWRIHKPSEELIKQYEQKKLQFTNSLNKRIYEELLSVEAKRSKDTASKPLTEEQNKIISYLKEGKLIPEVSKLLSVSSQLIYQQLALIRKKGITIKPIKQGSEVISYEIID